MSRAPRMIALALLASTALLSPGSALAQTSGPAELAVPDAAAVSLDRGTSALVVMDILQSTCTPNPRCMAMLPAVAASLSAARTANVQVVYTVHLAPDNNILPDVAPTTTDPVVAAVPGDKFFDSNLDYVLHQAGITQLVLTGVNSNLGILYTAAAAAQRGYTVAVAADAIAGADDLATSVALWQLLHGPGANPQNVPLQAKSVTLTRTDRISYH